MHRIAQGQRNAASRGGDVVGTDVLHALVVLAKANPPLGLDGAGRRVLDHLDHVLAFAVRDLSQGNLGGSSRAGIAILVERHVGDAAVVRDGRRLPFR